MRAFRTDLFICGDATKKKERVPSNVSDPANAQRQRSDSVTEEAGAVKAQKLRHTHNVTSFI